MSATRRAMAAALLALALAGCGDGQDRQEPTAKESHCWGDYEAGGRRMGPYECAGDGVTPIIR